jgi:TolB-like protein
MHRLVASFWIVSAFFSLHAETVLVLPFSNQSNSTNLDWIGESISEALRESLVSGDVLALEREDRLEVFRRLSLRPNAVLTLASIIKVGEALDASEVVYGHYDLADSAVGSSRGMLRIGARILNLRRLRQGPDLEESGAVEDLAALEARLSWQVLKTLSPKTAPGEQAFLRARPRVRLDALESYMRGLLAASPEQRHRCGVFSALLPTGQVLLG